MLSAAKQFLGQLDRGAWIRFFVAIAGLSLAFIAAMYSTVFREQGNLIATAVAGSLALLLAGVIGLTTVPYLARRVALERVRHAFDYDVTREGIAYLLVSLLIGIAALNTGNNLLFIIVAAMLAAVIVSGISSAALLRGLDLQVEVPDQVFARKPSRARFLLRNLRRRAPAFSVSVVPPKTPKHERAWEWQRSEFRWPKKQARVRLPDYVLRRKEQARPAGQIFAGEVYFPFLPPRSTQAATVETEFPRRGRYAQDAFGLATRFPFSFLVKTRRVELAREIIVYPPVEPTDEMLDILPMITGEFEALVQGRGTDLYRIREYQPQDTARHVDWKATARTGALKVREYTREDERRLRVVFDNPAPGALSPEDYERAVELAASLAWHFGDGATELSFGAPGFVGGDLHSFLRYLALVAPQETTAELESMLAGNDYNVVITARPRGGVPTHLWDSSYFVFFEGKQHPSSGSSARI